MIKNKVVLVPFPFDDFTNIKVRPALCLSNTVGRCEHVVIAFISSRMPEELLQTDLVIRKETSEFATIGLAVDSVIRIHKLVTIPKILIKRELGSISTFLQNEIQQRIDKLFKP